MSKVEEIKARMDAARKGPFDMHNKGAYVEMMMRAPKDVAFLLDEVERLKKGQDSLKKIIAGHEDRSNV